MTDRMPNILFVQTDQLTIDVLGAYHRPLAITPAIDRLAADGVVFDTFYCNVPLCAPSRASMMTGMLGSRIGAFDNGTELPASVPTYAHYLRQAGYYTSLCGKMHFIGPDQLHGFETRRTSDIYPGDFAWTPDWSQGGFHGATDSRVLTDSGVCARSVQLDYDDDVTHQAVQEIFDCARREDGRPFFLQVSYTHPHDPYLCRQDHWDRYEGVNIPLPRVEMPASDQNDPHSRRLLAQHGFDRAGVSPEVIQQTRRAYCGSVSYIDDQLATLVAALEDSGQRNDTVIVFTSDHGEMLGERGMWLKKSFFEPSARVPLIISAPDRFAPDRFARGHVTTPGSLVDLLPTFMGFATGGEWEGAVDRLDGTDLRRFMAGDVVEPDRPVYAEMLFEGIPAPIFMIRRGRYKLVTGTGDPDMLYDLETDENECRNLAEDPAHAKVLASLRAEADSMWDSEGLAATIRQSQSRRHLIRAAHAVGAAPSWDFRPSPLADDRWYRGVGNYNDWAMDYLPRRRD